MSSSSEHNYQTSSSSSSSASGSSSNETVLNQNRALMKCRNYKTEMCRNVIDLGNCKYGYKCHYAHRQSELRYQPQPVGPKKHRKHRTQLCKDYEDGICYYGKRCGFIHRTEPPALEQCPEAAPTNFVDIFFDPHCPEMMNSLETFFQIFSSIEPKL